MDYKFKFKPKSEKKNFAERKDQFLSDLLLAIHKSKLYKKIGFKGDSSVHYHINRTGSIFGEDQEEIDFSGLRVQNLYFSDAIKIEDSKQFKKQIDRIAKKHNKKNNQNFIDKVPNDGINEFDSSFDTVSFGSHSTIVIKNINTLDLIKAVTINYIKGQESYFIVNYKIHPSEKFNNLLFKYLSVKEKVRITHIRISDFFRFKSGSSNGFSYQFQGAEYWVNKLLNEINYQTKSVLLNKLNIGTFAKNKEVLLPRIVNFSYNESNFDKYKEGLLRKLNSGRYKYQDKGFVITKESCDFKRKSSHAINMFFNEKTDESESSGLYSVISLSRFYTDEIVPK